MLQEVLLRDVCTSSQFEHCMTIKAKRLILEAQRISLMEKVIYEAKDREGAMEVEECRAARTNVSAKKSSIASPTHTISSCRLTHSTV